MFLNTVPILAVNVLVAIFIISSASAFINCQSYNNINNIHHRSLQRLKYKRSLPLGMVVEIGPTDDDVEPALPGEMKISEIKSELDLRKVSYNDCFDRQSLEIRLNDARSSGKSDPSIIDKFNKQNLDANIKGESFEVTDDMIENATGGDGTLPGGMPPEMMKAMMGDEELVTMLRSPKFQDIMKLMMEGGQSELEKKMAEDPETYECVTKLNELMGRLNLGG